MTAWETSTMTVPPSDPPVATGNGQHDGFDWDQIVTYVKRWYAPLLERQGWVAALYLFVGMASGVGFFVLTLVFGLVTFALCLALLGLLLVRPFFRTAQALAGVERRMARWIGISIEPRPIAPLRGLGLRAVADPERWRHVGFLLLNSMIGVIIGQVGLIGYWGLTSTAVEDPFDTSFATIVLAVIFLGAAPRIAVFIARFKAQMTAWFLGVDQLAIAQARVNTLSNQREEILDAVAAERRRIERNLHDGVQQQLVAIGLDLAMAEQQLTADPPKARELIVGARGKLQGSIGELRQLGRGLHPAILSDKGVDAALSAVVANASIPVSVHVDPELDLPTDVAETVYFIASEAITNVLKHAQARVASVHIAKVGTNVRITVHDDGQGGADTASGTGIAGIRARVHGVDGTINVTSPKGGPTTVIAELPHRGKTSP